MSTLNLEPEPSQAVYADDETLRQMKGGANWFFWLAGLSMINSVIFASGGEMNFVTGLGITQVVDGILVVMAGGESGFGLIRTMGLAINLLIAGLIAVFGVFAGKGKIWAFVIGMIVYGLDSLIFLVVGEWFTVAFHGLALFFIFRGAMAARLYNAATRSL